MRTLSNGVYKRKSGKKRFAALALAILLPGLAIAGPDIFDQLFTSETVNPTVTADDLGITLLIKYIGSGTTEGVSGTITVEADGNLTFKQGVLASEAASTELECPVSGALGGIIDVSDAACNTNGEVVDIINASSNWRAVIIDGLRADSSNDTYTAAAVASANDAEGLKITNDTSIFLAGETRLLSPWREDIRAYLNANGTLKANPHAGSRAVAFRWTMTNTYASGTSTMQVIQALSDPRARTETSSLLVAEASGATTVAKTLDFGDYGIVGGKDRRVLVRVLNSAAQTVVTSYPFGLWYRYPKANEAR